MFKILVGLWNQLKVFKQADTSSYPDIVEFKDGWITIKFYGHSGGIHWYDYDKETIFLLLDQFLKNWEKWFDGYKKVSSTLFPCQLEELASRCGFITQGKKWITKQEFSQLGEKALTLASSVSVFYKSDYKSMKFFCRDCGKEIFQDIDIGKDTTPLQSMHFVCYCSDCLLVAVKEMEESTL